MTPTVLLLRQQKILTLSLAFAEDEYFHTEDEAQEGYAS